MNEFTTKVRMLPVCACGYIFRKGIDVDSDVVNTNGMLHKVNRINPPKCPNCKRNIECIELVEGTVKVYENKKNNKREKLKVREKL